MLMLDVRNAIAAILDRYTLADVVEVTTRKMVTSGRPLPYSTPVARRPTGPKPGRAAPRQHQPHRGRHPSTPGRLRHMSQNSSSLKPDPAAEASAQAEWLRVVQEKVETLRYGVVQLIVHDGRVTQIERTEKTRLFTPATGMARASDPFNTYRPPAEAIHIKPAHHQLTRPREVPMKTKKTSSHEERILPPNRARPAGARPRHAGAPRR